MSQSSKSIRDDSLIQSAKAKKKLITTMAMSAVHYQLIQFSPFIYLISVTHWLFISTPGFIVLPRITLPREIGPRQRI